MSFQLPTTTTASSTGGFTFGLPQTTGTAAAIAAPATQTAQAAVKPQATLFAAPGPAQGAGDAATTPKALTFGLAPATTQPTTTAAAPTFGFGLGSAAAPSAPATIAAATTTSTAATTTTTGFSLGAKTTAVVPLATATSSAATTTTTTTAGLGGASTGFASLTTATKTTDSTAMANATHLNYHKLEEHINKWTLELEDQEKIFTDQATQINAWDKVLINNNEKIMELNDAVQKVKADQQTLEQELEFISTQHQELEESLAPLQKEFMKLPQVDVERSQTYLMVENLDTQLKQMSEDLKEIIDNLNETNKGQDNTDPIIQIGNILNAHMTSLQWIESSTNTISHKLDEINKMHEAFKRESERSFRSAYYN